jgi:carbonic anhydrase/acetyltransferase-like protein (isoleucine patch superfamily)
MFDWQGITVIDKVTVQKHVMVVASLVLEGKELASGCLHLGNPKRKLRSLNYQEIGHFMCSANH